MNAVGMLKEDKGGPERVVVICERRITSAEHCPKCDSRRKTRVNNLGWVCTVCFERCKATAEQLVEIGNGVSRIRQAYDLAVHSYKEVQAA
jgi:ribosomal protein L37AE/L43A